MTLRVPPSLPFSLRLAGNCECFAGNLSPFRRGSLWCAACLLARAAYALLFPSFIRFHVAGCHRAVLQRDKGVREAGVYPVPVPVDAAGGEGAGIAVEEDFRFFVHTHEIIAAPGRNGYGTIVRFPGNAAAKVPRVHVCYLMKREHGPVCDVQAGMPAPEADGDRHAGRGTVAGSCHHVRGIVRGEDAVDGSAFAQVVCFEPDFRAGGSPGKDFGGPTGLATEAGVRNGAVAGGLDAGGMECYRILHGEGEPPAGVVAEGRHVVSRFRLG